MSVKQKHGKGKYAYQAKKSGKNGEQQHAVNLNAVPDDAVKTEAVKTGIDVVRTKSATAVMPANIGKIDLMYEMKRTGILSVCILALLVILSLVLK
jgi:hypothetical protein